MAEWSIAAVLKTVDLNGSGGSNPSLSANEGVSKQLDTPSFFLLPPLFSIAAPAERSCPPYAAVSAC